MRGYCRKCRAEWNGADQFEQHLHPPAPRVCPCGRTTWEQGGVCAHCQIITEQVAS